MMWFCLLIAAGCGESDPNAPLAGTRTDSAGIAVWQIPGTDASAPYRPERIGRLARPDSGWVAHPDGVAVDRSAGRIYVLDEEVPRILVFGFDGDFRATLGQEGQGPGEYRGPLALSVDRGGNLHAIDPGSGRIHTWSRDGSFAGSMELAADYWGPGFEMSPRGPLYTSIGQVEAEVMLDALVVAESSVDTIHGVPMNWRTLDMPCGRMPVPEVFYRSNIWAADDERLAVAAVPEYRIDLLDGLEERRPVASFRRDVPPREVSKAEAVASVSSGPLQFLVEGCGMTAARVVADAGYVDRVSPFLALTLDPAGRVWVARGRRADVDAIDILDPERGYVGTLQSERFPVAFLDESRFLAIDEGTWGTTLEIWRLAESAADR